jgi:hypothetical protein
VFTNCPSAKPSTFLDDVTNRKGKDGKLTSNKAVAYRFKLNWIILIAFYCLQTFKTITYDNVGELIENTYKTLLGWMTAATYEGMFFKNSNPILKNSVVTYSEGVTKKITADITGDTTFTLLKTKIIEKLCEASMTTDAANHDDDPEDEDPEFVPEPYSDGGSSDWTSDDGDTSSRSSLSSARLGNVPYKRRNLVPVAKDTVFSRVPTKPSSQSSGPEVLLDLSKLQDTTQGWLSDARKAGDDGRTRLMRQQIPDILPVGPRTPSPPPQPEVLLDLGYRPSAINRDWIENAKIYEGDPGQITNMRPLTSRRPEKSSPPPSGSLSDRRPTSTRTDLVNPNNPLQKPNPTSNLPGQVPQPPPESSNFIRRTAKPPTAAAPAATYTAATSSPVSTTVQPPIGNSPLQRRTRTLPKRGGKKRTRKHRSAPTPAPATRRRHGVIRPPPEKGHKYTRRRART